jgi:RNA polymerase sigma factor (sigma-70 family)
MDFEELYQAHRGTVRHEVLKWGTFPRDRADVEQDAWMRITQVWETAPWETAENPQQYLRAVVRNHARKALAHHFGLHYEGGEVAHTARNRAMMGLRLAGLYQEDDPGYAPPTASSAEMDYFERSRLPRFWAEVGRLPEKQRDCITLRYDHEMLPQQIADKLGMTANSVGWHITSGVKALRERLNPGQDSYPSARLPLPKDDSTMCRGEIPHVFDENNLPQYHGGKRTCPRCRAIRDKRYYEKKRAL